MLNISRRCTDKIITRALLLDGKPLVAILRPGAEDCETCFDSDQLKQNLEA